MPVVDQAFYYVLDARSILMDEETEFHAGKLEMMSQQLRLVDWQFSNRRLSHPVPSSYLCVLRAFAVKSPRDAITWSKVRRLRFQISNLPPPQFAIEWQPGHRFLLTAVRQLRIQIG
jgi:hypothetical protein